MNKLKLEQVGRALLICLTGILIFLLIFSIAGLIYPFIIAFFIAFLMRPCITKMEDITRLPRGLTIVFCLLICFSVISAMLFIITSEVIQGSIFLKDHLPESIEMLTTKTIHFFEQKILPIYNEFLYYFKQLSDSQQNTVLHQFEHLTKTLSNGITKGLETILSLIPLLFFIIPNSLVTCMFIMLGTYFLLKDWEYLKKQTSRFIPRQIFAPTREVLNYLKRALFGFMKAQLLIVFITGGLILIGLFILKVKYAITITLFAMALDLLPYIGTGILFLPWIIYLIIFGQVKTALGILTLYIIIIVIRQIIEPKILATNIGLHPLFLLIAVFIAMKIWGVFGLLFGPVILVCINACIETGVLRMMFCYIKDGKVN